MDDTDREGRTAWQVIRRIGVFVLIVTFLNTLDRVNIGFAALTMNRELGFDPEVYGLGVSIFFASYVIGQIPATWLGQRFGVARSLPVLIILWGLVAMSMGAVQGRLSFYGLRVLLGLAEAGATPMVLVLQAQWIPQKVLGRYSMVIALALPASVILGAPLSGWLMTSFHQVGTISGWRWMFMAEGALTILFGIGASRWLPAGPREAAWLSDAGRSWLSAQIARDSRAAAAETGTAGLWGEILATIGDGRCWAFAAAFFCSTMGFYAFLYWLPQMLKAISGGLGTMAVTWLTVLPWISATAGILLIAYLSDRNRERYLHVVAAALIGAAGLAAASWVSNPWQGFAALLVAGFGLGATQIVFWTIPMGALRGTPQAGTAFAFINLMGNVAGLTGGWLIGFLRQSSGSFTSAILVLSLLLIVEVGILLALRRFSPAAVPAAIGGD